MPLCHAATAAELILNMTTKVLSGQLPDAAHAAMVRAALLHSDNSEWGAQKKFFYYYIYLFFVGLLF